MTVEDLQKYEADLASTQVKLREELQALGADYVVASGAGEPGSVVSSGRGGEIEMKEEDAIKLIEQKVTETFTKIQADAVAKLKEAAAAADPEQMKKVTDELAGFKAKHEALMKDHDDLKTKYEALHTAHMAITKAMEEDKATKLKEMTLITERDAKMKTLEAEIVKLKEAVATKAAGGTVATETQAAEGARTGTGGASAPEVRTGGTDLGSLMEGAKSERQRRDD